MDYNYKMERVNGGPVFVPWGLQATVYILQSPSFLPGLTSFPSRSALPFSPSLYPQPDQVVLCGLFPSVSFPDT